MLTQLNLSTYHTTWVNYIENVRRTHEQIIDLINPDKLKFAGWDKGANEKAVNLINDFKKYIEENKNEITALQIYYNQPRRRKELTHKMIKELLKKIKAEKPVFTPFHLWQAYERIDNVKNQNPKNELIALVSIIRRIMEIDTMLTAYDSTVNKKFQDWVFKKQAGTLKFNEEQMSFLRMIKEHIASSFHFEPDDFELIEQGALGKAYKVFGKELYKIIDELNDVLAA